MNHGFLLSIDLFEASFSIFLLILNNIEINSYPIRVNTEPTIIVRMPLMMPIRPVPKLYLNKKRLEKIITRPEIAIRIKLIQ